jgi:hypothetical protein
MKTNQLMKVLIGSGSFEIEHKTQLGNLRQVWELGNAYRTQRGKDAKDFKTYLQSKGLREYVIELEKKLDLNVSLSWGESKTKSGGKAASITHSDLFKVTKGKYSTTWAHLYILIDAAMHLDPRFKLDVIDTFVHGKLLQHRDESGDAYKAMNIALDIAFPINNEKQCVARYVALADAIGQYLGIKRGEWNQASYEQLEARTKIEFNLTVILRNGFASSFDQIVKSVPGILG